jgi:hypothetical protein
MALLQSCPEMLRANDCNGSRDMKLKVGLSLRETADTARRVSVPPA